MHALEEHVALLEARLRQSHPSLALDHLSPVLQRASILSGLPIDEDGDVNQETLNAGDADGTDWISAPTDGGLLPTNFNTAELADNSMNGFVDPALGSTSAQSLLVTDGDGYIEPLIERPGGLSSTLARRHLSISIGSSYASEYFLNAHPMWPFLHEQQWNDCWRRWESPVGGSTRAAWTDFFADMVCTVVTTGDAFLPHDTGSVHRGTSCPER